MIKIGKYFTINGKIKKLIDISVDGIDILFDVLDIEKKEVTGIYNIAGGKEIEDLKEFIEAKINEYERAIEEMNIKIKNLKEV